MWVSGVFAQDGVVGLGGDALGRMHSDRVPVGDVFSEIITAGGVDSRHAAGQVATPVISDRIWAVNAVD
jgi:hypothetical protein